MTRPCIKAQNFQTKYMGALCQAKLCNCRSPFLIFFCTMNNIHPCKCWAHSFSIVVTCCVLASIYKSLKLCLIHSSFKLCPATEAKWSIMSLQNLCWCSQFFTSRTFSIFCILAVVKCWTIWSFYFQRLRQDSKSGSIPAATELWNYICTAFNSASMVWFVNEKEKHCLFTFHFHSAICDKSGWK